MGRAVRRICLRISFQRGIKLQGRQPEFAARELAPVVKKHLQMAVARAPTKLYFDVLIAHELRR